jgi:pimeloyl-ACP methyl ester carboxylesterase
MSDAFSSACEIPVAGGTLTVARAGPPVEAADGVVLAVHGIAASHLAWASVARELSATTSASLLAPDLRGRGSSTQLPGPYGIAAHVADLVALLDFVEADSVVLAGHSMGAYVAARLAAEHPDRVSGLVLIDGGLPVPFPADRDPDDVLRAVVGPSLARLGVTFARSEDYLDMWRLHPAFAGPWDADVEAYLTYDMVDVPDDERPDAVRSTTSASAVHTDGMELLVDDITRTAVTHVQMPVRLLVAERGVLDDDNPLMPPTVVDEFRAARPEARVQTVSDTNHYSILLGPGPGAGTVATAIRSALAAA